MNEESETDLVHQIALGEGSRLPREAVESLPQRQISVFPLVGLFALLADRHMLLLKHYLPICLPEIAEAGGRPVIFGHAFPDSVTRRVAGMTKEIGRTCRARLQSASQDERIRSLQLKKLQISSRSRTSSYYTGGASFIQPETAWRETPKT
jgi:hypothetical protein